MLIIGIAGKKQAGKSTAATVLAEVFESKFQASVEIIGFADKLKQIVLDCFVPSEWDWGIKDLELDENKNRELPCGKTARQLLQKVGTDWFRETFSECWINALDVQVQKSKAEVIIVPDVRFRNELRYIQQRNGPVLRLTRAPFADKDQHISETALDGVAEYTKDVLVESGCGWDGYYVLARSNVTDEGKVFDVYLNNSDMTLCDKNGWLEQLVDVHFGVSEMLAIEFNPYGFGC